MSHNFKVEAGNHRICSQCGDEKGVDVERPCPFPQTQGLLPFPPVPSPFDIFASEFYQIMLSTNFSNSLLQLPNGKTFPVEFGKRHAGVLLKRRFYDVLIEIVFNCKNTITGFEGAIFIGPPGSGKSWCAMYFLWYLIRLHRTIVYESVATERFWVFSPNGCRSCDGKANTGNCSELVSLDTFFLFDARAGESCHEPCDCAALLVLFSSPNLASHKQTERRNNVITFGFVGPSVDELIVLGKALNISELDITRKFIKYGPDVRFVLGTFETVADQYLARAVFRFNPDGLISYRDGTNSADVNKNENPAVLFKTSAREAEYDTLQEAYLFSNVEWSFASSQILDMVASKYKSSMKKFVNKVISATAGVSALSGLRAQFLEISAPGCIALGGSIGVRALTTNNNKVCGPVSIETFPAVVVEKASYASNQVLEMLKNCTDTTKLYNICGSFPAVDLYNPPFNFYQLTVHGNGIHLIDLNAILIICRTVRIRFGDAARVKLYFVVPTDRFDEWKNMQSFKYDPETGGKQMQCTLSNLDQGVKQVLSNLQQFVYKYDINK